jgi:peptidoglycan/xylan/chitin deacetylase (PgdA/CDA1 family)
MERAPRHAGVQLTVFQRLNRKLSHHVPVGRGRLPPLARGVMSVTFDDFPKSAWEIGGEVMAQHGAKGTYYASGGYCGRTVAGLRQYDMRDLEAVRQAGHEIGCHTYDHVSSLCDSPRGYLSSIQRNRRFLEARLPGLSLRSFAYPYGHASLLHKLCLTRRFGTCRGIVPGLNGSRVETASLRAVPFERRQMRQHDLPKLIEQAAEQRLWLIVFTHDVSECPSDYGCTPAELDALLSLAKAAALDILPVGSMPLGRNA